MRKTSLPRAFRAQFKGRFATPKSPLLDTIARGARCDVHVPEHNLPRPSRNLPRRPSGSNQSFIDRI